MAWVRCQHCKGSGKVPVKVSKWEMKSCPACGGSGKVNTVLV